MLTSVLILIVTFASVQSFIQYFCAIRTTHITFFIWIPSWNKQKILLVFIYLFVAFLLEYWCLWGQRWSVICHTKCNISSVAIAWLAMVWDLGRMPARIKAGSLSVTAWENWYRFIEFSIGKNVKLRKDHGLFFLLFCIYEFLSLL